MQGQSQTRPWEATATTFHRLVFTVISATVLLTQRMSAGAGASTSASEPIQSIKGMLYAENFTYYKLSGEGWLRLELYSLTGDVDLYVSGHTLTPSFHEYELKSESCGMDTVDIHSSMNRPVGIGIYAHPFYMNSAFRMDIHMVTEHETDDYDRLFKAFHLYNDDELNDRDDSSRTKSSRKAKASLDSEEDEQESVWWNILVTIIKFILEVIM